MRVLARVTERTRIVFIANPNNPTGTYLGAAGDGPAARRPAGLRCCSRSTPPMPSSSTATTTKPGSRWSIGPDNVVMLRTFSKVYALAGLRLGWAYCPPAIADVLNRDAQSVQCERTRTRGRCRGGRGCRSARTGPSAHNQRWLAMVFRAARSTRHSRSLRAWPISCSPASPTIRARTPMRRFAFSAVARHSDPQDGGLRVAAVSEDHNRDRRGDGARGSDTRPRSWPRDERKAVRPRGADRDRADRVLARPGAAPRQPRAPRSSLAPGAPRHWRRCGGSRLPTRRPHDPAAGGGGRRSRGDRDAALRLCRNRREDRAGAEGRMRS